MVKAEPVNETHVMRKVVIDGSTPFGFQRTAIVALNGEIKTRKKTIPIQTVCVEEDACRKTGEKDQVVHYRLDRLGAPLIEVVTAPVITSPEEAEQVALSLGRILRATGRVKRGIGTIRQDLNISIKGGAISEIKGVQEIELVSKIAKFEIQRQLNLLDIRDKIKARGIKKEDLLIDIQDVTEIFKGTKCKIFENSRKRGGKIMVVVLPKFEGILGIEIMPSVRFGTEISDYAKFWGGVRGMFHTDELPAFDITEHEIRKLRNFLRINKDDSVIIVADLEENARNALTAAVERVKTAILGVPKETRTACPDGTTRYSRPRPGAARMYPETDVPPVVITQNLLKQVQGNIPEFPEVKMARLIREHGLNEKLANQVLNSEYCEVFEKISRKTRIPASIIAATLTETFKDMSRHEIDLDKLKKSTIEEIFDRVDAGIIAKEAIPEVITLMVKNRDAKIDEVISSLDMKMVSEAAQIKIVEKIVEENVTLIQEKGTNAFGALMGIIMKDLRGKADAKMISNILKEKIEEKRRKQK